MLSLRASNEGLPSLPSCVNGLSPFFFLPLTAAEAIITGRRVGTEAAIAEEGGTQLAAARGRCSS